MVDVRFPFQPDAHGRTATATADEHLRNLIEQVLFTTPGERVNRPDFGAGLLQLVFAPTSDAVAITAQMTVQAALQKSLGDRIQVREVAVEAVEATLTVTVRYLVLRRQQPQVAVFTRSL
jgi:phage baseplate assembly protein W